MRMLSPPVDRIGAALKALRQARAHGVQSQDKLTLGLKCLHAVTAQLAEEGLPQEDLKPLLDLEPRVRQTLSPLHSETVSNRRKRRPPSEILLARACALIDLLIKGGSDEAEAAQTTMRRLVAAGIPPPKQGAMPAGGSVSSNGASILATGSSQKMPSKSTWPSRASSKRSPRQSACSAR